MIDAMQRWRGLDAVPRGVGHAVASIGVFDGVHRGHQEILRHATEAAAESGARAVVVTFDPHPSTVVRPDAAPLMLATLDRRLELLAEQGVDATLVLPFTRELSLLSADEFVDTVLLDALHTCRVVVGANFRFGHKAAGDVDLLRRRGASAGFDVDPVDLLSLAGGPVSSTWIRERVAAGDVAAAASGLGRPHRVAGEVVRGDGRGRELGFPTANVAVPDGLAVPADGVYAGWLVRGSEARHAAAVSIGTNPTFDGVERRVEAYALDGDPADPDWDLYGQTVAVDFAERLRGMVRFEGVPALVEQMHQDVDRTRQLLG